MRWLPDGCMPPLSTPGNHYLRVRVAGYWSECAPLQRGTHGHRRRAPGCSRLGSYGTTASKRGLEPCQLFSAVGPRRSFRRNTSRWGGPAGAYPVVRGRRRRIHISDLDNDCPSCVVSAPCLVNPKAEARQSSYCGPLSRGCHRSGVRGTPTGLQGRPPGRRTGRSRYSVSARVGRRRGRSARSIVRQHPSTSAEVVTPRWFRRSLPHGLTPACRLTLRVASAWLERPRRGNGWKSLPAIFH